MVSQKGLKNWPVRHYLNNFRSNEALRSANSAIEPQEAELFDDIFYFFLLWFFVYNNIIYIYNIWLHFYARKATFSSWACPTMPRPTVQYVDTVLYVLYRYNTSKHNMLFFSDGRYKHSWRTTTFSKPIDPALGTQQSSRWVVLKTNDVFYAIFLHGFWYKGLLLL
jgi:hypothetical protein